MTIEERSGIANHFTAELRCYVAVETAERS